MSESTVRSVLGFSAVALLSGLLFGGGLVVAGMTDPEKVRGFLDFAGRWDPTLALVMGAAVAVHAPAVRVASGRSMPRFATAFQLPTRRDLDARLLVGSAVFGVGWGLGGYCPGPAVTSLTTGQPAVAVFVLAMLSSSWLVGRLERPTAAQRGLDNNSTSRAASGASPGR